MNAEATLSPREYEIAAHISWGKTQKEIGSTLSISQHTVGNTLRNIYEKLAIHNVAELVAWMFCKKFNASMVKNPLLSALFMIVMSATTFRKEFNSGRYSTKEDYCNGRKVNENTTM